MRIAYLPIRVPITYPHRPRSGPRALEAPTVVGVLRHAKPSGGVSPACRSLGWRNSPPGNGAQAMTHVRLVPKLETTSVKYVENGLLWVKWSVLWVTNACSAGPLDALRSETIAVGIP